MKRIVLASTFVALSALGAVAQNAPVAVSAALQSQILSLVPSADLSSLTNVQYAQLVSLFSNSDNVGAGDDPSGAVKAILGAQ